MSTDQAGVLADLDAQMTALIGAPYTNLRTDIKDKMLTAIAYAISHFTGAGTASTEALGTTGADVNVGASAPPTAGQGLVATDATHATWQTLPSGGVTDHAALTSNLAWGTSGHTGTASRLAGFGGGGATAYYQIGVDVAAYDAGIASLASADSAAGLAYPSAANTWSLLALAADKGIYATGAGALATYDLTASGRALGGITLAATSVVVGTGAGTAGVLASTRGAVMVGGAAGWTVYPLGASGTVLQSNGTDLIAGTIGGAALGGILTTQGDMMIREAATVERLPGNTTTTRKFLRQTGTGSASAAPAWDILSAGDIPSHSTTQTLAADGTMDADVDQLRVTAACTVTLRAISTLSVGRPTIILVEATTPILVQLVPDAVDKIEGAARAVLVASRGVYVLTPGVATKWTLSAPRGLAQWLHTAVDVSTASGASPWTISGTTWTNISTASSAFAAAAGGLEATAKTSSSYYGSASADCALVHSPVSGLVDGWSRPMDPIRGRYWILSMWSRTTTVGGSSVIAYTAMGGSAVSNTPRIGIRDETGGATVDVMARDSGARTLATIGTSTTSAGWMGYRWDGPALRVTGSMRSTSPSGNPGEASGWWPSTYETADYVSVGQDFWGAQWRPDSLTHVHLAQTNTTTGSKATWTYLSILCEIGTPG